MTLDVSELTSVTVEVAEFEERKRVFKNNYGCEWSEERERQLKHAEENLAGWKILQEEITALHKALMKRYPPGLFFNKRQIQSHNRLPKLLEKFWADGAQNGVNRFKNSFQSSDREATKKQEEADRLKKNAEISQRIQDEQREYLNGAVQYLLDAGWKFNETFNIENAIESAEKLAFLREREKLVSIGGYAEFDGVEDCRRDEQCLGVYVDHDLFDKGHRCQCGNHRVHAIVGYHHRYNKPDVNFYCY